MPFNVLIYKTLKCILFNVSLIQEKININTEEIKNICTLENVLKYNPRYTKWQLRSILE